MNDFLSGDISSGEQKNQDKPIGEINLLFNILMQDAIPFPLNLKSFVIDSRIGGRCLYLIESGNFMVLRCIDNMHYGTGVGPSILGLQEIFSTAPWHYVKLLGPAKVWQVSLDLAYNRIDSANAWKSVSMLMSYYLRRVIVHEENILGKSSYEIICYCLKEYMKYRDVYIGNNIGLVNFILSATNLSRSLVNRIISELRIGGYISVEKGKLVKISHLPLKY